jgi:hypothetical protein
MAGITISVPTIDFAKMYYADIVKLLIQYRRQNVPAITDENEYEPYVQMERAFALVGHLNNVLLDVVANESLLPTARLLESVRNHLKLIGYELTQASPASTDVIYELSKVFTSETAFIPQYTQVGTVETESRPPIVYEALNPVTVDRTDRVSYVYTWNSAIIEVLDNGLENGDYVALNGTSFIVHTDFSIGATIEDTAENLLKAINTSIADNIFRKIMGRRVGTKIYLFNMDEFTQIRLTKSDNAVVNFATTDGYWSAEFAPDANTDGTYFTPLPNPKPNDCIYFGHRQIQFDQLTFKIDTFSAGIKGVWEYYDGDVEDASPTSVQNLGSALKIDVSSIFDAGVDYSGALVRVKLEETAVVEDAVSFYENGVNYIQTTSTLGQSTPSEVANDYVIGALWQALPDLVDDTYNFQESADVTFTLPESVTRQWLKRILMALYDGYYIRYRVIEVQSVFTTPIIERVLIDKGGQYVKASISQGETRIEDPLGGSNGTSKQSFSLVYAPLIVGSLVVEVNEGTGFQGWNNVPNFLSSDRNAKDYVVEIKGDDTVIVHFGDGIQGKIPAIGVDNIRCRYRIGAAEDGNVGSSVITDNVSGISFVNRLWNPRQASGWVQKEGSTKESLERAKIEGPASIRVLERGITASDVEYLARKYRDQNGSILVTRSQTFEETFGIKTVELIVVGVGGNQLSVNQRGDIQNYFNGNKPLGIEGCLVVNQEVTVVNYTKRMINVDVTTYGGDPVAIETAIRQFLHPEAMYNDGLTYRWAFSTPEVKTYLRMSLLSSIIYETDPADITNVVITNPPQDIEFALRELPYAGIVNVTVI